MRMLTPLCHFVTSPPQGGRSFFSITRSKPAANLPPCGGDAPIGAEGGRARHILTILITLLLPLPALAAPSKSDVETKFQTWIKTEIYPEARKAGVSDKTLQAAFAGVQLNWDLPDLAPPGFPPPKERPQSQAEFSSPAPYFNNDRLQRLATTGRGFATQYASTLKRIEKTYGVPGPIVLAIWGRETGFGAATMKNSAISILATDAFMAATRKDMFHNELVIALGILEHGDVTPDQFKSSYAGALGQPQFMPSSYLKFAVDFDGDGHRNIWTSVPDTLASIANFLAQKGWQRGRGWGYEATIPAKLSCAQEGPDIAKPIGQWASMGITQVGGGAFPKDELKADGMMLVPAGRDGPGFIVTPNFYVIKEYNNSDLYGLYIGNLADRIAGNTGPFKAPWGDVGKMLRSDVASMQRALEKKGYDVGGTDGLPGFKTRRSIGAWQAKNGENPTCYPEASMLGVLK